MSKIRDFTDEQIVEAVGAGTMGGGRSTHILRRLVGDYAKPDHRLRQLYLRLMKLEAIGKVHRCPHSSFINSIFWVPGACSTPTQEGR